MIVQPSAAEGYVPGAGHYTYETMKPMVDALHSIDKRYMESTIFTPVSYLQDHYISLASEENTVNTVKFYKKIP